jgi:hypothetical protein
MATVDKAFRIKNGLVVEGSSATVNGSNVLTEASTSTVTNKTLTSPIIDGDGIIFEGTTPDSYETTLTVTDPTADRTITLPNITGTVITNGDTGTVTNTMLAGSIANDKLTNSSVTINGNSVSLGGSTTITAAAPNALTIGTGLSGTSYNGSSAVTIAIDSTVATTSGSQTLTNKTISSTSNTISVTSGNVTDFNEAAQDTIAAAIAGGTQTNISITYDDTAGTFSFNASGGVSSVSGTANQITASTSTGAVTLSLPSSVTFPGTVTLNADPSQPLQAATKQYVDDVAQGLHIHPSSVTATTSNLTATYSNGTSGVGATLTNSGTQAALVIDGITLNTNDRVLVKNQTSQLQNGIYTVTDIGSVSTNWVLTRATDMDQSAEVDGGDFTFVTGGTVNDNTGWVQTSTGVTIGTDAIVWQQFSGAGTYLAGNGLTLTGNIFTIDTSITADLNSVQSLSNKTLTSPVLTTPSISGLLVLDNNIVIEGTNDTHETTLTFTDPTQDNTITFKDATGTVAFTSDIETAIDGFGNAVTSTTGISVSYASTSNILTIGNTGVTSIAGTADQVSANTSTGSVTLSLPQSIASTSSPTFAGLSVGSGSLTAGSIILTDALIGTATTSLSDTSATVVDSWSATNYKSAKYIVQMRDGNDIEVLEVLVTIDGNNNVYLTEYADIQSNAQIGTTDADYDSGNVRLKVTATGTTTVKVHKTLIEA